VESQECFLERSVGPKRLCRLLARLRGWPAEPSFQLATGDPRRPGPLPGPWWRRPDQSCRPDEDVRHCGEGTVRARPSCRTHANRPRPSPVGSKDPRLSRGVDRCTARDDPGRLATGTRVSEIARQLGTSRQTVMRAREVPQLRVAGRRRHSCPQNLDLPVIARARYSRRSRRG
jgi:hypothetical protein